MKTATNYYKTNSETRNKILRRFSMFDGVGLDLTGAQSYEEALNMAGLDYTADKAPLFLENGMQVPDHFAVLKSDNPACVLGVVGNQYHAVSNADAFAVADDIVKKGNYNYEVGGPSFGAKKHPRLRKELPRSQGRRFPNRGRRL